MDQKKTDTDFSASNYCALCGRFVENPCVPGNPPVTGTR